MATTRREFLAQAAAALPVLDPRWWRWVPDGPERSLIVIELSGGNDGLNTIAPAEDAAYRKARPTLAIDARTAPALRSGLFLHPSLQPLSRWFADGAATAVLGVGYPDPDRSHFRSMDIWHTAVVQDPLPAHGWLGRAADALAARGEQVPALAVGALRVPLMLGAQRVTVPALARLEDYQIQVDPALAPDAAARRRATLGLTAEDAGAALAGGGDLAAFLGDTARAAARSSEALRTALDRYRPATTFPDTALGRSLALCARVVASGFGTRILFASQGGYDTHAAQATTQSLLLRDLAEAVAALLAELRAHGQLDRTLVLCFSEFGRRVAENQSRGTDHGAAGPMLLFGGRVRGPTVGAMPSLTDLLGGDLRPAIDFRSVYAEVLAVWLGLDARTILGGDHGTASCLAAV